MGEFEKTGADLTGLGSNTNVRVIDGVLSIWDTTTNEWREISFANGVWQIGEGSP